MKFNLKIILLITIFVIGCIICTNTKIQSNMMFMSRTYGPLTLAEVLDVATLPVHIVDQEVKHKELEEVYYFFNDSPELILATYFITNTQIGEPIRVAKMVTYNVWGGLGPYDTSSKEITINWAQSKIGHGCKLFREGERSDRIFGESYQSCFYWLDEHNQYVLYTIWTEEETEEFVNSLIRVK